MSWSKFLLMKTKNPYVYLRERAGYTQKKFGQDFGFAKQTIIGIESGMYPELSYRMVTAIVDAAEKSGLNVHVEMNNEYDTPYLSTAYANWQKEARQKIDLDIVELRSDELFSPMHYFVKDTVGSVQGFAKKLKVPPATLLRYIRGEQRFMPTSIKKALTDTGWTGVNELEKFQLIWVSER